MRRHESQMPGYPRIESIIDAIAEWIRRYRYAIGIRDEFARCGPEDVAAIAKELGIDASDLQTLASKGPDAADLLKKMLIALHVDPNAFFEIDSPLAHDLRRMCITCSDKSRCARELAAGTAAKNYHAFCPNAVTLDALFGSNEPASVEGSATAEQNQTTSDQTTIAAPPAPFPPSFGRLAARPKHDTHH